MPREVRRITNHAADMGVDWWFWRLVASDFLRADPHELRSRWSFAEVLEAHVALDALEDLRDYWQEHGRKVPPS